MIRSPPKQRSASAAELAMLHRLLRVVAPLKPDDLAALPPPVRRELPAGTFFLRAGERATEVATVISGGLREYFVLSDGSERTKSFNLPGDFAGSLSDLLSGNTAKTWVVAENPTVLLVTPWDRYQHLARVRPGWAQFARAVAERLYLAKVQREYELLALDAEARYQSALCRWPVLESVFSQRHIASYIGITPVHLSRLRRRRQSAASSDSNPASG